METRPPRPREFQGGQARRVCQDEPRIPGPEPRGRSPRGRCGHGDSKNKRFPRTRLHTLSLLPPNWASGRLMKSTWFAGRSAHAPGATQARATTLFPRLPGLSRLTPREGGRGAQRRVKLPLVGGKTPGGFSGESVCAPVRAFVLEMVVWIYLFVTSGLYNFSNTPSLIA